ncbi:hypothetical protein KSS87_019852 [Heliosperma pusillum]|nr:hypothetical protein KSS87_019852 [Heliosperma pusillum]
MIIFTTQISSTHIIISTPIPILNTPLSGRNLVTRHEIKQLVSLPNVPPQRSRQGGGGGDALPAARSYGGWRISRRPEHSPWSPPGALTAARTVPPPLSRDAGGAVGSGNGEWGKGRERRRS